MVLADAALSPLLEAEEAALQQTSELEMLCAMDDDEEFLEKYFQTMHSISEKVCRL